MKPDKKSAIAAKAIISMVPQWYQAEYGENGDTLKVSGTEFLFHSHRPLTARLSRFLAAVNIGISRLLSSSLVTEPAFIPLLQEHYAIKWLKIANDDVNWTHIVKYLNTVAARTFEDRQVSVNLVISDGEGEHDIAKDHRQKFFDQLANTPFTYFRINPKGLWLDYGEVQWEDIHNKPSNGFHPAFLHPIHSILGENEISAHVTSNGDIVIMNKSGLLATKRKGHWKLYDLNTFRKSIVACLQSDQIAVNLFDVMFDLSFKRHGALLVYDPDGAVINKVVNKDSKFPTLGTVSGQRVIRDAVKDIAIGEEGGLDGKRRLLAEIASVDGAVIFNADHILAVGAVIEPHADAGNQGGARSTAAMSAFKHGGFPVKISSDGEVMIHFKSRDSSKNSCPAQLEFL